MRLQQKMDQSTLGKTRLVYLFNAGLKVMSDAPQVQFIRKNMVGGAHCFSTDWQKRLEDVLVYK